VALTLEGGTVFRRGLLLIGLLPLCGCTWAVREHTDQMVRDMVEHPFDVAPEPAPEPARPPAEAHPRDGASSSPAAGPTGDGPPAISRSGAETLRNPLARAMLLAGASSRSRSVDKAALVSEIPTGRPATTAMGSRRVPGRRDVPLEDDNVLAAAWTQPEPGPDGRIPPQPKLDLEISPRLPGSEAPRIVLPRDPAAREREIERLYPELPPLPVAPRPQPGPDGEPYTLEDFQRLAAANNPTIVQAASDVQAAQGNLIQARSYPNPTASFLQDPTDVNNSAGTQGGSLEQIIVTGGKMKLGVAAAQKNVDNAILALKRARMDLATSVRNAYFTLLVDLETLVVTRALVQFSDDIYRLQTGLLKGTRAAPYEPTALLAQTQLNRLAYKQAIQSYVMDWKALVATLGLPQLPLSEIAGQVDRFIPHYDYDEVRAYVLQHHTDVLTARNAVKIAQYNLKLAQVTPIVPNLDVTLALEKNFVVSPFGTYQQVIVGLPVPIWDQNKGNIIATQGALVRASEESHRVEVTLINNLTNAYGTYRNNLYSMEDYRRHILPDLVRYYRGIHERRQIDPTSAFGDLVFAQQNLAMNVQTYLNLLQSLWTSVVGVADYLQTDDLYQIAKRHDLPNLPDFRQLHPPDWVCGHETVATATFANHAEATDPGTAAPGAGPSPAPTTTGLPGAPQGPPAGANGDDAAAAAESHPGPARGDVPLTDDRVRTVAWTQSQPDSTSRRAPQPKLDLEISPRLPGSEAPRVRLPRERAAAEREIDRLYPELPPLPVEPRPQPGPGGKPYTLADLQHLAAASSPTLRQAVADVKTAEGNLVQAKTYTNPTASYMDLSSNNTNTAAAIGGFVDQPIITGGKMKLGVAAAQKALDNAVLALKRARMDLATSVRNAYFTLLVDLETLAVTRALAQFSDDIYRLQTGLLKGTQAAPYEPTALRAQTYLNRLAYRQAIASYIYDWKALVATLGLPQLPLSQIAGQVDRFIPYYDYDEVRAYVLQHHTDVLTARNAVKIAQYNLKLAQVTPLVPDLDVLMWWNKDFGNPPHGMYQDVRIGFPMPIWDQNKGNIIAAQAALVRATEESHRVEVTLTNGLALAYEGYRNNLYAMEYYRRNVLPDLVRYYRGIYARRQIDPTSAFGDLVFAQQNLSTNVTAYLGILGSLWSSVVGVADFLQTDDLYQFGKRRELPELPDFRELHPPQWVCGHESVAAPYGDGAGVGAPITAASGASVSPSGSAVVVPVSPVGSDAGPLPAREGAGGASPQPSRVVQPPPAGTGGASLPSSRTVSPAPPGPDAATGRPPAKPGGSERNATAWLGRRRATAVHPAAVIKSGFGEEANHEG
jgi:cobalt-zinc-cadmium efflux system outer membrane protein